jgi:oligosaccharyltransferase complex subunit beta
MIIALFWILLKVTATNTERGHELTFRPKSQQAATLIAYEERQFDNLVILSPSATFKGALGAGELIEFVNMGGNILLAGGESMSEALRDFAYEFSVDFRKPRVVDFFNGASTELDHTIIARDLVAPSAVVSSLTGPILYRGVGHWITGKNRLVGKVLHGSKTAFVTDAKVVTDTALLGSDVNLVSYFQALNGARVIFCGSNSMFSNK